MREKNNGIRKLCGCPRRNWPKCAHAWYFNFKPRGGKAYQFSLDVELERHPKTKEQAAAEADRIRGEIRAGTFVPVTQRRRAAPAVPPAGGASPMAPDVVTLEAFALTYLARVSEVRERNKSWTNDRHMFAQLAAFALPDETRLGVKPIGAITEDDLEAFTVALRQKGRAASTRNQYVQLLKKSFRWATKKGYVIRNPITEDAALTRTKIAQRHRRLAPDVVDQHGQIVTQGEERRLLNAATPRLQNLLIAALETACRRGELLALQWADVDLTRHELTVRAETAKDSDRRVLPISPRLAAVLTMARTDPGGDDYPATAYVFGELGTQTKDVKRAWATAVLKAHGHTPVWTNSALAPGSQAALKAIDLHFHDLRHEGASRMLEAGWPLHHIQLMLGHASLEQTSTYLNVEKTGLQDSMRRFAVPAGIRCKSVVIQEAKAALTEPEPDFDQIDKSLIN